MTRNRKFGIGAFLLISAIGYLVYAGVQQGSVYYFTIEEFLSQREAMADQGVRVAGRVAAGSVKKQVTATGTELQFTMADFTADNAVNGGGLRVQYTGIVPDMFAEGRDVIVEGKYVGGTLQAQSVMTSCPSKYEPGEDEAATGAQPAS